jgi:xylan 1,4-beta-xylosidase
MKDAGLDYSCYYHIRDYHVELALFQPFMSAEGAAAMARWWNRMPQYDGLFDYQNTMRPAYFAFKLLSRLVGSKLPAVSDDSKVHAFFTWDPTYKTHNLLVWNFSDVPADVTISFDGVDGNYIANRRRLDATTASNDENLRLRPLSRVALTAGASKQKVELEPYGIEYWEMIADRRR